jgi:uncharacterized protein (DUF779 family)
MSKFIRIDPYDHIVEDVTEDVESWIEGVPVTQNHSGFKVWNHEEYMIVEIK